MKINKRPRKSDTRNELMSPEPTSIPVSDAAIKVRAGDAGEWLPADTLRAELIHAVADGKPVTVDMESLNHLDAAVLQVLLAAELELKRNNKSLILENVSEDLRAWFGYAGSSFQFAENTEGVR